MCVRYWTLEKTGNSFFGFVTAKECRRKVMGGRGNQILGRRRRMCGQIRSCMLSPHAKFCREVNQKVVVKRARAKSKLDWKFTASPLNSLAANKIFFLPFGVIPLCQTGLVELGDLRRIRILCLRVTMELNATLRVKTSCTISHTIFWN